MEIILSLLYTLIFALIIYYSRFFNNLSLSVKLLIAIFVIKIISGISLNLIYTYYYTDKETSDIFKYFNDSKPIYDALYNNPFHFFQLIFGINDNADYLQQYIIKTSNWQNPTQEFIKHTGISDNDFFNSHRLITKFNALVRIFSFGYISVHVVFMCFLSLIGQVCLFKTFYPYLKNKKYELMIAIFLLPSVLLWSSGILKEGILIFGLGIFIYSVFRLLNKFNLWLLLLAIFSFMLICITKYYVLVALIPALTSFIIVYKTNNNFIILKYVLVLLSFTILISVIGYVSPKYNYLNILADKQADIIKNSKGGTYFVKKHPNGTENTIYITPETDLKGKIIDTDSKYKKHLLADIPYYIVIKNRIGDKVFYTQNDSSIYNIMYGSAKSGSYFEIPILESSLFSVIKNTPVALFNVMFRPFIHKANSFLLLFSAIENILLIIFSILCIAFMNRKLININLLMFCLTFVLISFMLIGLTTPVAGAIVRYKIVALPFFIIMLLLIVDFKKLFSQKK